MDCVVLTWLYYTIFGDLLESVMSVTTMARLVWRCLEQQFLGNCEYHVVNLQVEFHSFHQGELSVTDYCHKLKIMAENLAMWVNLSLISNLSSPPSQGKGGTGSGNTNLLRGGDDLVAGGKWCIAYYRGMGWHGGRARLSAL
ncbi:hypothetical protein OsJ_24014 [Oryza sativa Japonica Group]|uniref:Retrotransposon gag domain-containing protein n=1 Tax=Oryza sativa subsp. japonica TaxID=39947 RepID=B9FWX2_ORYSJ|nr:hypothetical protein OsJ_24014 [Oryza sativa Japonica Group]